MFEVLAVVFVLGVGVYSGSVRHAHFGILGSQVGFILGAGFAVGTPMLLVAIGNWWVPEQPRCWCGATAKAPYRFVGWRAEHNGSIHICKSCERRYVKIRRRFLEMDSDGTLRVYCSHTAFGRWKVDDGVRDARGVARV